MKTSRWCFNAVVAVTSFSLAGCFNPNYNEGGFACTKGECPEGYVCVAEGNQKVCRKQGAALDASVNQRDLTRDKTSGDSPVADGPRSDAPQGDLRRNDTRITDAPVIIDAPVSDNTPFVDSPVRFDRPISVDRPQALDTLPWPDLRQLDTSPLQDKLPWPDHPSPDTMSWPDTWHPDSWVPPECPYDDKLASNLLDTVLTYDLAVDSKSTPHVVYIDSNYLMHHMWRHQSQWMDEGVAIGFSADRIAAATDSSDRLHVAFRRSGIQSGIQSAPYHTYREISSTNWSSSNIVRNEAELGFGLDLAANGDNIYLTADRNTASGSAFYLIKIEMQGSGINYKTILNFSSSITYLTYSNSRVGVGPELVAASVFTSLNSWSISTAKHSGYTGASTGITGNSAFPLSVAVDSKGLVHMAYTVDSTNYLGSLIYVLWDPNTTVTSFTTVYAPLEVRAGSVDLTLDGNDNPYISFRIVPQDAARPPGQYFAYLSGTNWTLAKVYDGPGEGSRISVDKNNHVIIAHRRGTSINDDLFVSCRIP
jgi:hypothetical protein